MAITITNRSNVSDTTAGLSYPTTTAFTPGANGILLASIISSCPTDQNDADSVTGNGVTYTFYTGISRGTTFRHSLWIAESGSSPSNGVVTATWVGANRDGVIMHVAEVTSADISSENPTGVIVQNRTRGQNGQTTAALSPVLSAAANAGNRTYCSVEHGNTEGVAPSGSMSELFDSNISTPNTSFQTMWRSDAFETDPQGTWTTSANYTILAVEIALDGTLGAQANLTFQRVFV